MRLLWSCSICILLHQCFWICGVHTESYISFLIFDVIVSPEIEIVQGVPGTRVVLISCRQPSSVTLLSPSCLLWHWFVPINQDLSKSFSSSMCPPTWRIVHLIDEISSWCLISISMSYELHVELTVAPFNIAVTASTAPLQSHASSHCPVCLPIFLLLHSSFVYRIPPRMPPNSAR